jgi:hypothetical protein
MECQQIVGFSGKSMKRTRRRKVTVETERLLVISHYNEVQGWCEGCGAQVQMAGPEEAAAVAGLGQRAIFRLIESHQLHFTETADGGLLICVNSLLEKI